MFLPALVIVGAVAVFSVGTVLAWTAPTQTAPNNNAAPPLNTTATSQIKAGGLWAASIGSDSGYCIGGSCITQWPVSQLTTAGTSVYYNTGNFGIGTTTPGTLLSVQNVANFSTATSTFYSTGGINLVGASACFSVNGVCLGAGQWSQNGSHIHYSSGNVGVGASAPVTLLEVGSYARLAPQASAPATCDASRKGSIAIADATSRICVCNGTAWIHSYNGAACAWDAVHGSISYSTPGTYTFTVPDGVTAIDISVTGAGGGGGSGVYAGGCGGAGSIQSGHLNVVSGHQYTVTVGAGGASGGGSAAFGGGAVGGSTGGGVGGGRSAFLDGGTYLLVGAGGGGGSAGAETASFGFTPGYTGGNGDSDGNSYGGVNDAGKKGTASAGGAAGNATAQAGSYLTGGAGGAGYYAGGGGGGGYYGGGGGGTYSIAGAPAGAGGGGGGSYCASGVSTCSRGTALSGGAGSGSCISNSTKGRDGLVEIVW